MRGENYSFQGKLEQSNGEDVQRWVEKICMLAFPGVVKVRKAKPSDDRQGIDFWIGFENGSEQGLDLKLRERDCRNFGGDDVALETWSVIDQKIGWTLDKSKRTQWVLHLWEDTGRYVIWPFLMLHNVFRLHCEEWCAKFPMDRQRSNNGAWRSECVYVPLIVIDEAIGEMYGWDSEAYSPHDNEQRVDSMIEKKFHIITRRYGIHKYKTLFHECGSVLQDAMVAFTDYKDMMSRLRVMDQSDPEYQIFIKALNEEFRMPLQRIVPKVMTNYFDLLLTLQKSSRKRRIPPLVSSDEGIQSTLWEEQA